MGYLRLYPILWVVVVALGVIALVGLCNPPLSDWCFIELRQPSPNYIFICHGILQYV